jgi:cobaltochelatase CobN
MAAVNRAVGKGTARMYWGDSSDVDKPEIRTISEEISESLFSRLLNPEWIAQRKLDGSIGAHSVSGAINTLFHWSASARVVTDEEFDAVWRTYIANEENRRWLQSDNIYALEEITRRLLEAASRGLWIAREDRLEELRNVMLSIEGDIEDRMGPVRGEFQGSAVDMKRREDVEKWRYAFTIDDSKGGGNCLVRRSFG